jgi:hypothetical protein
MERRSFRFPVFSYQDRLNKEDRIRALMHEMSSGKWKFPPRVGHKPKGEKNDVMEVFLKEEFERWTPDGGAPHDDLLDVMGITLRPCFSERARWPSKDNVTAFPQSSILTTRHNISRSRGPSSGVSSWAR